MTYETIREQYSAATGYPVIWEKISFDASVASTSALTANTTYEFVSTQDCHILFAASPTATSAHPWLPAGIPKIIHMPIGSALKVAAIKDSTAGDLYISTMTADRV